MRHALVIVCALSLSASCGEMQSVSKVNAIASDPVPPGEIMKVRFERSGGFAGMVMDVDIDAAALSDEEREALMTHISNAKFFALPSEITDSSTTGADQFNYRITIESEGREHTVDCSHGSAPESLVPLLEWLNDAARHAQRNTTTRP